MQSTPAEAVRGRIRHLLLLAAAAGASLLFPLALSGQGTADAPRLSLEEAVRTALDGNRDLREARLTLDVANRQVTEAWGNVYPTLDLNAGYTRNVSAPKTFLPAIIFDPDADPSEQIQVQFGADNQWNSSLTLEQPLFQAVAFIGVGAAGRFRSLQEESLRGTAQEVVTRVRLAYYDLLLSEEQARLLQDSVERVMATLNESRALARAGLVSEYEVLRLEVEVANLEPQLRRAENAVLQNRRNLAVELGVDTPDGVMVEGSLAALNLEDLAGNEPENAAILAFAGLDTGEFSGDATPLVEQSLGNRSELQQLRLNEDLRRAELRAEQVQYFPEISLFGNYVVSAQQQGRPDFFGADATERFTATAVGVNLRWTIFNGFRREARVSQKRTELRQAQTRTELALDRSEAAIRSLLEELEEAGLRAAGQRLAVGQARRGFEIASAQYREGIGSRLELTDAEVALRQSEVNYAQAVYDVLAARARLDQAVGVVPMVDRGVTVRR